MSVVVGFFGVCLSLAFFFFFFSKSGSEKYANSYLKRIK
jgi:hypothetical protein